jgi:hypothetical protein
MVIRIQSPTISTVLMNGLPGHLEETLSSSKRSLLNVRLAKCRRALPDVARTCLHRQFSAFPQDSALFWLDKTNW